MAGRSVGSITVSVDANTGKLKAQVVRASTEAGQAGGQAIEEGLADVDGRRVVANIAKIREQIKRELRNLDIDVGVDDAGARADLRRLQAQLRALQLEIDVAPNVDEAGTLEEIVRLREKINKLLKVSVKTELDSRTVTEVNAEVQALIDEHITVHIEPEVDDGDLVGAMAKTRAAAGEGGSSSGRSFMSGFSSAIFDQEKLIVGAIGFLGNDIAVLLEGTLSAAIAVASSAFGALAGAAGAALPLLAGLVPAVGALVIGFQGMGGALQSVTKEFAAAVAEGRSFSLSADDIQKKLAGLAPAARSFVEQFARIFPQLDQLRTQIQGALFENLDTALSRLATTTIPNIGQALTVAAGSVNDFILQIAQASEGIDFAGLLEGLQPAIDAISKALVSLFQSIAPFIAAATPAAQRLAEMFRNAAENLAAMIDAGARSGAITDFLQRGLDSLHQWASLAKAVGDALFTLFQAGQAQGDSFVASLTNIINKFDAWMESAAGQNSLAQFFELGRQTMSALVPILEGLKGLFANLVSADSVSRLQALTDSIGRVLPFLGQVLDVVGRVGALSTFVELLARIGEAIQPAVPAFQELADALGDALMSAVDSVTPLLDGLGPLLGRVVEAIVPLIPKAAELSAQLIELVTPQLLETLDAFASALVDLSPSVIALLDAFTPFVDLMAAQLIAALEVATPLLNVMAGAFEALLPAIEAVAPVIEKVVGLFTLLPRAIGFVGNALRDAGIGFSDLANPAAAAGKVIHEVFTPGMERSVIIADQAAAAQEEFAKKVLAVAAAGVTQARHLEDQRKQVELNTETWLAYQKVFDLVVRAAQLADIANARQTTQIEAFRDRLEQLNTAGSDVIDPIERAGFAFEAAGGQAKRAADDAERLQQIFEDFIDPALNAQEAARNMAQEFSDFGDTLTGLIQDNALGDIVTGLGDATAAVNLTTQAGRDFGQGLEDRIKVIEDSTTATIGLVDAHTGLAKSGGQAAREMVLLRQQLIDQVTQLGLTNEQATALVNTYGLTPDSIVTTFTQTNMDDAQKQALQLDENLNGIPDSIETIISMPGITQAQKVTLLYDQDLDKIPDVIDTEVTTPGLKEVRVAIKGYDKDLDGIPDSIDQHVTQIGMDRARLNARELRREAREANDQHIDQPVTQPGMDRARQNARGLRGEAQQADAQNIAIPADIPGYAVAAANINSLIHSAENADNKTINISASAQTASAAADINALRQQADALDGKTIDIFFQRHDNAPIAVQHGGQVPQGMLGLAGETGPEFARVGGQTRLLLGPTIVPPGTTVTSAALTEAILRARGEGAQRATIGRQVILNQNITPVSADPVAVATQVMNRAAAMAGV